jgi:hypothetical protein
MISKQFLVVSLMTTNDAKTAAKPCLNLVIPTNTVAESAIESTTTTIICEEYFQHVSSSYHCVTRFFKSVWTKNEEYSPTSETRVDQNYRLNHCVLDLIQQPQIERKLPIHPLNQVILTVFYQFVGQKWHQNIREAFIPSISADHFLDRMKIKFIDHSQHSSNSPATEAMIPH